MNEELGNVVIYRYNPLVDSIPYYQTFENVPFENCSVLEVVNYIFVHRDSSLAFRRYCTKGLCGACLMNVNGKPVLTCQYQASKEMLIRPHHKFKVIRDLLVDFDQLNEFQGDSVPVGGEVNGKDHT